MRKSTLIRKLKKAFPTIKAIDRENDMNTIFISAEDESVDNTGLLLANYYCEFVTEKTHEFGISKELVDFLNKFNLYAEWENPGCLAVCL